jgi:uncharacterized membrane protein YraQ (UPF0718 family)
MLGLYIITVVALVMSAIINRPKTLSALKTAGRMFLNLLPSFVSILAIVAIALTALGPSTIQSWLGDEANPLAWLVAALTGAIALIPGFVAYPLAGILVQNGVAWPLIGVFITTLMMVGMLTIPLEAKFFGLRLSLARNGINFIAALIIGALMTLVWSII